MSTTNFTVDPQAAQEDLSPPRSPDRWWAHLFSRCARPDCPNRLKFWPTRLRKTIGVTFDGHWYCELPCLQPLLEYRLRNLLSPSVLPKSRAYRLPLGLLLVDNGAISPDLLRETLRLQREGGTGRIGDWLLQTRAISEQQLSVALAQQWGCPVFPLDAQHLHPSWSALVPFPLLESARAVPAHASPDSSVLHVAFADRLDHTLLFAIERMLECRTLACVASGAAITEFLAILRGSAERSEASFDTIRDPQEMARIICNYADELRATRLAIARVSEHIWVRFFRHTAIRDLLFRVSLAKTSTLSPGLAPRAEKALLPFVDARKDRGPATAKPL